MAFFHPVILRAHCDRCDSSEMDSRNPPKIGRNFQTSKLIFAVPATSPNRTEIAVHTSHEYPTSLSDQDVIDIGRESPEQPCDKPRCGTFDDDPEDGVEK
jgi:hypothetical protein